jgi:poly(A) polymerase
MPQFIPPPSVRALLDAAAAIARGAGVDAYVVGGTVRDALLGREMRDVDLAVDGDAVAFAFALADALGGSAFVLHDEHAVARVALPEGAVRYTDVARLRGSLTDDLALRDFRIDAMAAPADGGAIVDPFGGLDDLARRRVRMTSAVVLDADPLRLLRAVRLAGELGFELDSATAEAVRDRAPRLREPAPERRRDELSRIFALERSYPALLALDDLGLLAELLPEATAGRGVSQPVEHAYDVLEHNLRTVAVLDSILGEGPDVDDAWLRDDVRTAFSWAEPQLRGYLAAELGDGASRLALLKLAALLHDVAKPESRSVEHGGRVRFFGHADAGARTAAEIMARLRFSNEAARLVSTLVAEHLRPRQLAQPGEAPTRRALYRLYRDVGDTLPALLLLALADGASARGPALTKEEWRRQVAYMNALLVRSVEEEGIVSPPRLLTGNDIMSELGLTQGPIIGRLLAALEEAQAAGEVTDTEGALRFVTERARREEAAAGRST